MIGKKNSRSLVIRDYFILIDEIDLFQSEAYYRESLENTIDYYFLFHHQRRALVSATVRPFTNEKLRNEPVIELDYPEPKPRDLYLIHTGTTMEVVADLIIKIYEKYTDDNVVIALNSITGIKTVIEYCAEKIPHIVDECSILCSQNNQKRAGVYYKELIDSCLPSKITFITSSYFTGIDIYDRFRLISVSTAERHYRMLSPERLQQIAGRCRDSEGIIGFETIVYTTKEWVEDIDGQSIDEIVEYELEFAKDICNIHGKMVELNQKYPSIRSKSYVSAQKAIKKITLKGHDIANMPITRISIDGSLQPAYFNIDKIAEFQELKRNVYSTPNQLPTELSFKQNIINYQTINIPPTESQEKIKEKVNEEIGDSENLGLFYLIGHLEELEQKDALNSNIINNLLRTSETTVERKFLKRLKSLYGIVPIEELYVFMKDKEEGGNITSYRGFYNAAVFHALHPDHPFKMDFKRTFKEGEIYSATYIETEVKRMLKHHFGDIKDFMMGTPIKFFGSLVDERRYNTKKGTRKLESYNKHQLPDLPEEKCLRKDTDLDKAFDYKE